MAKRIPQRRIHRPAPPPLEKAEKSRPRKGAKTLMTVLILLTIIMLFAAVSRDPSSNYLGDLYSPIAPAVPSLASAAVVPSSKVKSDFFLDCSTDVTTGDGDDGLFVKTATKPSFEMNTHRPNVDGISKIIHRDGCWDCKRISEIQEILRSHPNSYFLDIGGNIGMYTLSMAAAGFDTFTFEPFPANWKRICRTIQKNGFQNRTHIINVAATAVPINLTISLPYSNNFGSASVKPAGQKDPNGGNSNEIHVRGIKIDSLSGSVLPTDRPVVAKLDVEGAELDALEGAMEFINQADLVYFVMEVRTSMLQRDQRAVQLMQRLHAKGLRPYRSTDGMLLDIEQVTSAWQHAKHPAVLYFDIIWKKD